eukprot:scaffold15487_cov54-Phaeocystis_antarctica.AAC.2
MVLFEHKAYVCRLRTGCGAPHCGAASAEPAAILQYCITLQHCNETSVNTSTTTLTRAVHAQCAARLRLAALHALHASLATAACLPAQPSALQRTSAWTATVNMRLAWARPRACATWNMLALRWMSMTVCANSEHCNTAAACEQNETSVNTPTTTLRFNKGGAQAQCAARLRLAAFHALHASLATAACVPSQPSAVQRTSAWTAIVNMRLAWARPRACATWNMLALRWMSMTVCANSDGPNP